MASVASAGDLEFVLSGKWSVCVCDWMWYHCWL